MKTCVSHPVYRVIDILPRPLAEEILRISAGRVGGAPEIREIMIRVGGLCSMLIGGESLRLHHRVGIDEADGLMERLTGRALYAHRESIASGYISLGGGVRVGVGGFAAYDGSRLVGVGEVRSLLFRIPSGSCAFGEELYSLFRSGIGRGMLIYSPPGVGKTTALRSLAMSVGRGRPPLRVCVVDERCEFPIEDFADCEVDVLRGYKRREGVEIATRTLSPDLIMIDEIGAEDGEALSAVVRCGIPLIATAHASDRGELFARPPVRRLLDMSVFSILVGIVRRGGEYTLEVDRI